MKDFLKKHGYDPERVNPKVIGIFLALVLIPIFIGLIAAAGADL